MNLKAMLLTFTAAVALSATASFAAITAEDVIKSYQEANFTSIEVKEGPTQIKVEAIKGGVKLEIVYDKASGEVVKRERRPATRAERNQTGVEVKSESDDFSDDSSGDDRSKGKGRGERSETETEHEHEDHMSGSDDHGDDHGSRGEAEREAKKDSAEAKREAKKDAAEAKREAKKDAAEAKREAKKDADEAKREAKKDSAEAKREAKKDAAEAKREAKKEKHDESDD